MAAYAAYAHPHSEVRLMSTFTTLAFTSSSPRTSLISASRCMTYSGTFHFHTFEFNSAEDSKNEILTISPLSVTAFLSVTLVSRMFLSLRDAGIAHHWTNYTEDIQVNRDPTKTPSVKDGCTQEISTLEIGWQNALDSREAGRRAELGLELPEK